ncbi:Spy/CpxP family protein refolding chaperone [Zhongshania aquatica]|uniref:Spy/CpxP family protein refolding chaperone n=1 Tax=Zhongshania aquatica TaxID=2965069 RepID=UPI0022B554A9|nr:Spy/CpxP family protein refolding chaperone [Marortus sp. BJYM1]
MKKLSFVMLLSLMLGGFSMSPVFADEAAFGGTRLDVLTEKLKLTTTQQGQIKTLLENYAKEAVTIRDGLVAAQESIRRVNLERLSDSDVTRLSREAGRLSTAHTKALLNTQRGFYGLLNKQQKREYNKMRSDALQAATAAK